MIRCRFKANLEDYRPVKWPIKHPYWCTGFNETHSVIVAYADNENQVKELWPEAIEIESEPAETYIFTDRFPKPEWL